MRYLSPRSWGGVSAGLLLLGAATVEAQTILYQRGPQTSSPAEQPTYPALTTQTVPAAAPPVIRTTQGPALSVDLPDGPAPGSRPGLYDLRQDQSSPSLGDPARNTPYGRPIPVPPPSSSGLTRVSAGAPPATPSNTPIVVPPLTSAGSPPVTPPTPPMARGDAFAPAPLPSGLPMLPQIVEPQPLSRSVEPTSSVTTPESGEYGRFVKSMIDPQTTLDLVSGRTRLMVLADAVKRIQVGDERALTVEQISPTELSLKARSVGTTVLNLWLPDPSNRDGQKILSYLVRVSPDPLAREREQVNYKSLAEEINRAFPESQVTLFTIGDKLAVQGQARDAAEAAQILQIVRAHAPMEFNTPLPNNVAVNVNLKTGDGGAESLTPALQQVLQAASPSVVNLLRVPGEQQVMLRVTVAEVDRAAACSIGLGCCGGSPDCPTILGNRTGQMAGLTDVGGASLPVFLDDGQIGLAVGALRNMSMAKSLAESNVVALNGQHAEFRAGGEFPTPGAQGVTFHPHGVHLSFTPVVSDHDRIRLCMQGEVSTKDLASTTSFGCADVPGVTTRTFSTTVEMRSGQSMAVAGLIQNTCGNGSAKAPLLSSIPGLGRLFESEVSSKGEQELLVLVTAELVHPLDCRELPPLPGAEPIHAAAPEAKAKNVVPAKLEEAPRPTPAPPARSVPIQPVISASSPVNPGPHMTFEQCETQLLAGPQGFSDGRP
jgi:pilus assembly protein CpaC